MTFTVYLLRDPSGAPRYVGLTTQPIRTRLRAHIMGNEQSGVAKWARSLRAQGKAPTVETLQTLNGFTTREPAEIVESAWIERMRADGADLLNRKGLMVPPDLGVLDGMPDERGAA